MLIGHKLLLPGGGAYMVEVKKKSGERSKAIMALLFLIPFPIYNKSAADNFKHNLGKS